MSERKVLNKYYPPDFDPSKIPKLRLPRNRQYSIRVMAPFNMRCNTCGEYIYKGKKFNSRKETVEEENYLGLHIFRFYIKCPRCVSEIAFKTDPKNTDYELEDGAVRNFEALRTAEMMARKEAEDKEAEEANNPMKLLEKRTKASQQEMEMIETLEDLRNANSRNAKLDLTSMTEKYRAYEEQLRLLQEEEDENTVRSIFGKSEDGLFKRLPDEDEDEEEDDVPLKKVKKSSDLTQKPTDLLTEGSKQSSSSKTKNTPAVWEKSVGSLSTNKKSLGLLVKKKTASNLDKPAAVKLESETRSDTGAVTEHKAANGKAATSTEVKPQSLIGKPATNTSAPSALGLLGNYSDSESDQSD